MQEKRLKYILLPVVLFIWGAATWRYFFSGGEEGQAGPRVAVATPVVEDLAVTEELSFALLEDYRDPFLARAGNWDTGKDFGDSESSSPANPVGSPPVKVPAVARPKSQPTPPAMNWDQFRYLGLVRNSSGDGDSSGKVVGLLWQNGHSRPVEVGGIYRQLEIISITSDSMHIRWQGEPHKIGRL